jgi:hypothetical protein
MSTVMAVAAAVACAFAVGSLMRQVDGPTLRRWRLSRRWDVSRLAREFIAAADEPLATLRGLMHMINAWERGVRKPSERYWLLYLRVFPECAFGETANGGPMEAEALTAEIDAMEAATFTLSSADGVNLSDFRALAATVRILEQQIARLTTRLEELSRSGNGNGNGKQHQKKKSRKPSPGQLRQNLMLFLTAFTPSLGALNCGPLE